MSRDPVTWSEAKDFINIDDDDDMADNRIDDEKTLEELRDQKFRDPLGIHRVIPPRLRVGSKSAQIEIESSDFNALVFLKEVHTQTKFDELMFGYRKMQKKLETKVDDIKALVRENFDRFVDCKDVIDNIYALVVKNEMSQNTGSGKMEVTYNNIVTLSQTIYGPLLSRRQEVERIRTVLSVLSRYKFLFKLPAKILEHIAQGDLDKAVQSYRKALSKTQLASLGIFKKVMDEVESIVEDLRQQLYSVLQDQNEYLDDQEKVIRILYELGPSKKDPLKGDPAWYYLSHQHKSLCNLLIQSAEEAQSPALISETGPVGARHKQAKKLCSIVHSNMLGFYKMGKYWVEGRFDSYGNAKMSSSTTILPPANQTNAKDNKQENDVSTGDAKFASIRVCYSDGTFSNYKIGSKKQTKDLLDLCKKRLPDSEDSSDYSLYIWTEKKQKDGSKKVKLVELSPTDRPYKIHKKWGDKNGVTNKFLFKKRSERYPIINDSRTVVKVVSLSGESPQLSSASTQIRVKKSEHKSTEIKPTNSEAEVKALVVDILKIFCERAGSLLFSMDDTENEVLENSEDITGNEIRNENSSWSISQLRTNVLDIVNCYQELQALNMPNGYLGPFPNFVEKVSKFFITRVCAQLVAEVALLYLAEDWAPLSAAKQENAVKKKDNENDKNDSVIIILPGTSLPLEFAEIIKVNLKELLGVVGKGHPQLILVQRALAESFSCFADTLHHLTIVSTNNTNSQSTTNSPPLISISKPSIAISSSNLLTNHNDHENGDNNHDDNLNNNHDQERNASNENSSSRDARLLLIMGNSIYTRLVLFPQLVSFFYDEFKLGPSPSFPLTEEKVSLAAAELSVFFNSQNIFGQLENVVLQRYMQSKSHTISTLLRQGFLLNGVDWRASLNPTSPTDYIMEVLVYCVCIHAEIMASVGISAVLYPTEDNNGKEITVLWRVISHVLENVLLEIQQSLSMIEVISYGGAKQLLLDCEFLSTIFSPFETAYSKTTLSNVIEEIEHKERSDDSENSNVGANREDIINVTKLKTHLLFACFNPREKQPIFKPTTRSRSLGAGSGSKPSRSRK